MLETNGLAKESRTTVLHILWLTSYKSSLVILELISIHLSQLFFAVSVGRPANLQGGELRNYNYRIITTY